MSGYKSAQAQFAEWIGGQVTAYWPGIFFDQLTAAVFATKLQFFKPDEIAAALGKIKAGGAKNIPGIDEVEAVCRSEQTKLRQHQTAGTLPEDYYCEICGKEGTVEQVVWWYDRRPIGIDRLVIHPRACYPHIAVAQLPCRCAAGHIYGAGKYNERERRENAEKRLPGCWALATARDRFGNPLKDDHGCVSRRRFWLSPGQIGWTFVAVCSLANSVAPLAPKLSQCWEGMIRGIYREAELPDDRQNFELWEPFSEQFARLSAGIEERKRAAPAVGAPRTGEDSRTEWRERGGVMEAGSFKF